MERISDDEAADPDPADLPCGAGMLYVPVRRGPSGDCQLRFARTPLGARTAVGFTSKGRLAAVFGERQPWILLAEPALRALGAPLGALVVTVDPQLTAVPSAPPSPAGRRTAPVMSCARRTLGPLDVPEAMAV
ncbi:hypothetical protein HY68_24600 [Streptomyces sp. AcH 505]|uniref:SAV_915 family protein n=1 Tax=Streptomyces sp. AcH 505 TaxID=352211 RepID=UPI0005921830|nr:hypothetical protein HY68_24600 [Streptomyces sp. AcH 505]